MSAAVNKVDGIRAVDVNVDGGTAEIELEPNNTATVDAVRNFIREAGYTPRSTEVEVAGSVREEGGKVSLTVSGPGVVYVLVDPPGGKGRVAAVAVLKAKRVVVKGTIPEQTDDRAPRTIVLSSAAPAAGST